MWNQNQNTNTVTDKINKIFSHFKYFTTLTTSKQICLFECFILKTTVSSALFRLFFVSNIFLIYFTNFQKTVSDSFIHILSVLCFVFIWFMYKIVYFCIVLVSVLMYVYYVFDISHFPFTAPALCVPEYCPNT